MHFSKFYKGNDKEYCTVRMMENALKILALIAAISLVLSLLSITYLYITLNELNKSISLLDDTQNSLIDIFAPEGFELLKEAKAEGKLDLMGTLTYSWVEEYIAAFTEKYPWIDVEYTRLLTQEQLPRLQADRAAGTPVFDYNVGISFPSAQYFQLVDEDYYLQYVPASLSEWPQDPFYIDSELGGFNIVVFTYCIVYNEDLVSSEKIPTTWWNLTDSSYVGRVGMTDPRIAGGAWNQYYHLLQVYGEEWFSAMAPNTPFLSPSVVTIANKIASEELMIGMGLDTYTWPLIDKDAPLGIVYPEDGSYTLGIRANVLADAPHPNCAKLFHDFMASAEGQRVNLEKLRIYSAYFHDKSPRVAEGIPPLNDIPSASVPFDAYTYFDEYIDDIEEWLGIG